MKNLTIGVIAEGPRDVELVTALVNDIVPGNHRFLTLQPDGSTTKGFGTNGAGWVGVINWCQTVPKEFKGLRGFLRGINPTIDILIIQLDAEIAREPAVNCAAPCPPAANTVNNLKQLIIRYLQEANLPDEVVFCIPSDNTEAWVLCAYDEQTPLHNPPHTCLECFHKPDYEISKQGYNRPQRLLRRKSDGSPDKNRRAYNPLIEKVVEKWNAVKQICPQAAAFEQSLIARVQQLNP